MSYGEMTGVMQQPDVIVTSLDLKNLTHVAMTCLRPLHLSVRLRQRLRLPACKVDCTSVPIDSPKSDLEQVLGILDNLGGGLYREDCQGGG